MLNEVQHFKLIYKSTRRRVMDFTMLTLQTVSDIW